METIDEKEKKDKNIKVTVSTRERLKNFGIKGETFDEVINNLMDKAEELSRMKKDRIR